MSKENRSRMTWRTWLGLGVIFLMIPAVAALGAGLGGRFYYLVSVLVIVLTMVPFFLTFERRRPQAREVAVLAVMCALAVASRAAFMAIPHFKPMAAIIMISGIAFGPEAGFLVGAISGFASNFIFGQGPWTPWQMFAYGMGGFLAGGVFKLQVLPQKPLPMALFGFAVVVLVVGPLLDISTLLLASSDMDATSLWAVLASGFPVNLVHGAATLLTLLLVGKPLLEKLDRLKLKYGMMEGGDHGI